jgi:hypothetical protein
MDVVSHPDAKEGSRLFKNILRSTGEYLWATVGSDFVLGRTYTLTFWAKSDSTGEISAFIDAVRYPPDQVVGGAGWQQLTRTFVAKHDGWAGFSFLTQCTGWTGADCTFLYDDFRITSDEAPTSCYAAHSPSISSLASIIPTSSSSSSLATSSSSPPPPPIGCGQIPNPSFEQGDDEWSILALPANNPGLSIATLTPEESLHGSNGNALMLFHETGNLAWGTTIRDLVIGRLYFIAYWVRSTEDGASTLTIDGIRFEQHPCTG